MKTLNSTLWLVSLFAIASVTACKSDDDDNESGASLDSGVDPSKAGEDLTQEENEALCQAGEDYITEKFFSDNFRTICRVVAAQVAIDEGGDQETLRATCSYVYERCTDCVDDPAAEGCEDFPSLEPEDTDCANEPPLEECTSTVGELEVCGKAYLDEGLSWITDAPACDQLTEDTERPEAPAESPSPEECESVEENCPQILE